MKFLIDTHIWIWSVLEPGRLSKRVARVLSAAENEIWISPVSSWEILLLSDRGRLTLEPDAQVWLWASIARATHEVVMEIHKIDLPHRDPADRFLAATARSFGLTLVTADENLIRGRGYQVLANR